MMCVVDDAPHITRRTLPHWQASGYAYFLTWRLHRSQKLLNPEERTLVAAALQHFHGERYYLYCWVVMDDHVHLIAAPTGERNLSSLLHTWKSFTSHELVKRFQRLAPVWQEESYDRAVRNEHELYEKAEYILSNPQRRWPGLTDYPWCGYCL